MVCGYASAAGIGISASRIVDREACGREDFPFILVVYRGGLRRDALPSECADY